MTEATVKRYGLLLALQTEVEGMKVFNKERMTNGEPPGYNEQHFNHMAEQMRNITHAHDDQILLGEVG